MGCAGGDGRECGPGATHAGCRRRVRPQRGNGGGAATAAQSPRRPHLSGSVFRRQDRRRPSRAHDERDAAADLAARVARRLRRRRGRRGTARWRSVEVPRALQRPDAGGAGARTQPLVLGATLHGRRRAAVHARVAQPAAAPRRESMPPPQRRPPAVAAASRARSAARRSCCREPTRMAASTTASRRSRRLATSRIAVRAPRRSGAVPAHDVAAHRRQRRQVQLVVHSYFNLSYRQPPRDAVPMRTRAGLWPSEAAGSGFRGHRHAEAQEFDRADPCPRRSQRRRRRRGRRRPFVRHCAAAVPLGRAVPRRGSSAMLARAALRRPSRKARVAASSMAAARTPRWRRRCEMPTTSPRAARLRRYPHPPLPAEQVQ